MEEIKRLEKAYIRSGGSREALRNLFAAANARWGEKIEALTGNGYLLIGEGEEDGEVYYALQGDTYPERGSIRAAGGRFVRPAGAFPSWRMSAAALDKLVAGI